MMTAAEPSKKRRKLNPAADLETSHAAKQSPRSAKGRNTVKRKSTSAAEKENTTPPRAAELIAIAQLVLDKQPSARKKGAIDGRKKNASDGPARSTKTSSRALQTVQSPSPETSTDNVRSRTVPSRVLQIAREELVARAAGRKDIPLVDRQDELAKVTNLVKQAVETGESNSMMLIGPRGVGKSALINQVLRAQQETTPNDFHIVRLNGFIHTDDKLALRDIWRQLGREMDLDEAETSTRSYADTMSMLLALLSHPLELGQSTQPNQITKSVIFVLDEFDLFTTSTHPRQTLLYILFDIVQSRKAPIAVIGSTTRIDVVEALEKRVKSRFSHRYVHVAPASLASYINICKAFLTLDTAKGWNTAIDALLDNEEFLGHIRKIYHRSKSVPSFLTTMHIPLALLPTSNDMSVEAVVEHFLSTISLSVLGPQSKLDMLSSLSTLQLALLICAARQNAIHATENVSFNLAYEEYKAIAGKAKLQATGTLGGTRVWCKDTAKSAWADLVDSGLILEDGRGTSKVDLALEELAQSDIDLGQWARWCKEI